MPTATQTGIESNQHGLSKHSHGGGFVPIQTRSERPRSANHADFAAVTGLEAEWKLTPVRKLAPLIDDELDGSVYEFVTNASGDVTAEWAGRDHELIGRAGLPEERASANAWSSFEQALVISVSGDNGTLVLERDGLGGKPRAAHTIVHAEPNSRGMVILQNRGEARLSENVEIVVDEGAELTVVTVQEWSDDAHHLASHFARVGRDASLKHVLVSLGGEVVRVNPSVHLAEQGAEAELFGLYFADAHQHLEQRPFVHHDGPHTRSRVSYKGALNGDGARTVWVGDVLIGRDATGTDTYEENRNLVLSDGTRADSIPNLEIETGDIAGAGHASATGRFDDEQLFYLTSRGIPELEARRLVVLGFLAEIVQKIGHAQLEERLLEALQLELDAAERMP